jgi:hypothetical protein
VAAHLWPYSDFGFANDDLPDIVIADARERARALCERERRWARQDATHDR